jgi:3-hydroxyisobutyrate dehydrogenase-like beta-hydroxyacid dehydrogenase
MSHVAVIGLGNMGAALARALLAGGHEVTVWNRTPDKASGLVSMGARRALELPELFAASPVVVRWLSVLTVALEVLQQAPGALESHVVVQLTAGTTLEAQRMDQWCRAHGAELLAGMVMVYPSAVGTAACRIVYAGEADLFDRLSPVLASFGGTQRLVGPDVGAVGAIAMSALEAYYLGLLGFVHAATLAGQAGVPAAVLLDEVIAMQDVIGEGMRDAVHELDTGEPEVAKATIGLGLHNVGRIVASCRALGVDDALPSALLSALRRAVDHGLDDRAVAAMSSVLRRPPDTGPGGGPGPAPSEPSA